MVSIRPPEVPSREAEAAPKDPIFIPPEIVGAEADFRKEATGDKVATETLPTQVILPQCGNVKVGGRIALFLQKWRTLTYDPWVLQTVQGFQIDFYATPRQSHTPKPLHFSRVEKSFIDSEVASLMQKGAIVHTTPHPHGFVSTVFLVPKKDLGYRLVLNLKDFNLWVVYCHFKMEGIHLLRDLLLEGDWMVRLDLKDAYLAVPIFPPHRQFLQFQWRNAWYEFSALPFGLSFAPWCFTKLLKPVIQFLQERGIRLIYLDDILIMAESVQTVLQHLDLTTQLLQELGFVINSDKSIITPAQSMEFLGFQVNSVTTQLLLPLKKRIAIKKELRRALSSQTISLRTLARLVGLLASSIQAIFRGPLHYRALQRLKILHLRKGLSYTEQILLSQEARTEISWWLDHMDAWNGKAIFASVPEVVIESDASRWGWGARCCSVETGGGADGLQRN